MKRLIAVLGVVLLASVARAADVSGDWELATKVLDDVTYARVALKVDGEKLSGTLNELKLEGTIKGDDLTFTATRPNGQRFGEFKGRGNADELRGTVSGPGIPGGDTTWTGKRARKAPGQPKTYEFEPTAFHRVFSDAIPPVLHIFPGDTVRTWTVDAGGTDAKGVRRSLGGNPETGPFYVEGAMPGDTLSVKFTRIRLNRDSAGSGDRIVPSAVQPGYFRNAKFDDKFDSNWKLDREAGVAMLAKPSEHLTNYTVKLRPMLGCIAVAPPGHQSLRTGYPGV